MQEQFTYIPDKVLDFSDFGAVVTEMKYLCTFGLQNSLVKVLTDWHQWMLAHNDRMQLTESEIADLVALIDQVRQAAPLRMDAPCQDIMRWLQRYTDTCWPKKQPTHGK